MRRATIALIIAALGAAASGLAAQGQPASGAGETATTRPATQPGRWHIWYTTGFANNPAAVSAREIWFRGRGGVWRYDLATQTIDAFDMLDGLDEQYHRNPLFVGPTGQAALTGSRGIYLYTPATQPGSATANTGSTAHSARRGRWQLLPKINGGPLIVFPFGPDGTLFAGCFADAEILCYEPADDGPGSWRGVGPWRFDDAGKSNGGNPPVARMPDPGGGWLMAVSVDSGAVAHGPPCILNDESKGITQLGVTGHWYLVGPACQDGDSLLAVFRVDGGTRFVASAGHDGAWPSEPGPPVLRACRITADGSKTLVEDTRVGLDLKGHGAIRLALLDESDDGQRFGVNSTAAGPLGQIIVPPDRYPAELPMPIRDANGHLWLGDWRWDGKSWKRFAPPACLTPAEAEFVLAPGRAQLDARTMAWQPICPEAPARLTGFNAKDRTGWLAVGDKDSCEIQQVRYDAAGGRTVLRSVRDEKAVQLPTSTAPALPAMAYPGGASRWEKYVDTAGKIRYRLRELVRPLLAVPTPQFLSPDGDWWWRRLTPAGQWLAFRLLPSGAVKTYPMTFSFLALGGGGKVWQYTTKNSASRFDPASDSFVPGQLCDDFAFQLGGLTLSSVAGPRSGGLKARDDCGFIYRKGDSGWAPFSCSAKEADAAPADPDRRGPQDYVLYNFANSVRGDRMLANVSGLGIFEYDGTHDRWAMLHSDGSFFAEFDPAGRRIFCCKPNRDGALILCFDGDPFNPGGAAGDEIDTLFNRLIGQMDDPDYKVRQQATARMKELAPRVLERLRAVAADDDASPEVRERVRELLAGLAPESQRPISLFTRMNPPIGGGP